MGIPWNPVESCGSAKRTGCGAKRGAWSASGGTADGFTGSHGWFHMNYYDKKHDEISDLTFLYQRVRINMKKQGHMMLRLGSIGVGWIHEQAWAVVCSRWWLFFFYVCVCVWCHQKMLEIWLHLKASRLWSFLGIFFQKVSWASMAFLQPPMITWHSWLVVWNIFFPYIGKNNPNWLHDKQKTTKWSRTQKPFVRNV